MRQNLIFTNLVSRSSFLLGRKATAAAIALTVATTLAMVPRTNADTWTGLGDGSSYEDVLNWSDNTPFPGDTRDIDGNFIVTRDIGVTANRTFVDGGAVLNITAGVHSDSQSGASIRNFVGGGSPGTINQTGGSWDIGHSLVVGNNTNSDGRYNLSGGSLELSRGATSVVGDSGLGRPSLDIAGQGGTGLLEISGGTFSTRFGAHIGGDGVFEVIGTGATSIGIGNISSQDGWWFQTPGGTLRTGIDSTGVTPIVVFDSEMGEGNAIFQDGSILDPYDLGGAATNVWVDVLTWTGTLDDAGLTLSSAAVAEGWEQRFEGTALQVRLVPEPSSLALLSLGFLALVGRRRK